MRVSTRNILAGGAGLSALLCLGGVAVSQTANPAPGNGGPCCQSNRSQSIIVPGVNVAGPNVVIGGTNVNVRGGNLSVSGQTYLNVTASAQASSEAVAYVGTSAGVSGSALVSTSSVSSLNVTGSETYTETVTEDVPTIEDYCVDEISYSTAYRAVQAVCLDDGGSPHPASQVNPDRSVAPGYSGELFRCMAGTRMQVTLGSVENDETSFDHGQTMSCAKGEALVHSPGGKLACKPQTPQRNCNERSLLRRYGPGTKVIKTKTAETVCVPKQRTVMKSVTREVERVRPVEGGSMVFDGGVGQGVY
ncbi:hypothetical protein [Henriciella aquimarina]|uniref:hypothetical protein n=1 Tax=Henriciella aquimarina TaxID=545261 RepID=UPI0009FDE729|nr:hypothetical protein [Henriciella aquimarina]